MNELSFRNTPIQIDVAAVHVLHRDIESRSKISLRKVGVHRYAADSTTEISCVAYAVDDGPVQLWLPSNPPPAEWFEAATDPSWLACAHGDHFETAIEQHILGPRHGFPIIPSRRHCCTQAACLSLGLPARLSAAADALELMNRKDIAGERLMHQMSKPRRPRQGEDPNITYWFDDAERLERLCGYCQQDVATERDLQRRPLHCRPRSRRSGCFPTRSMAAAFASIEPSPKPRARLLRPQLPKSMLSLPRSPKAPSLPSIRLHEC